LNFDAWCDEVNLSVEHVAPRTKEEERDGWDWPREMYDDPDAINLLGNLILFPQAMNSHLSNRSWKYKSAVYKILSEKTREGADLAFEEAAATGLEFDEETRAVLDAHSHLQQTEALSTINEPWGIELVRRRTRNLAELAWDELAPWLDPATDGTLAPNGSTDRPVIEPEALVDSLSADTNGDDAGLVDLDEEDAKE
jgi:hypothetical protein